MSIHPKNEGVGRGNAPEQLANLTPIYGVDRARELQKKSVESRRINTERREALKMTAKEWKSLGSDIIADLPPAIDIIKIQMLQYIEEGKILEATELAKVLAEYEQPKLSRVDSINQNIDASDLSDEELEARLKSLEGE